MNAVNEGMSMLMIRKLVVCGQSIFSNNVTKACKTDHLNINK